MDQRREKMKLKTTEVAVPATVKRVVSNVQSFRTQISAMNMEVVMRADGSYADYASHKLGQPATQCGRAEGFRELAAFLTAIADEMERRSVVQS